MRDTRLLSEKSAPVKMVKFIAEVLHDLPAPCRLISVEVRDASYAVTVALPDGAVSTRHVSPWDMSRGLRGDPAARAALRAGLATPAGIR